MLAKSMVCTWVLALMLLLAANVSADTADDKACEEIKMRFACRARPDCKWLGGQSICETSDPDATKTPTVPTAAKPTKAPTTRKPTKAPTTRVPTLPKTKGPTLEPTVKTKRPTFSPGTIVTKAPSTHKPTKAPTFRQCKEIGKKANCLTGVGKGRCEWWKEQCIVIRSPKPTQSPTTSAPSFSPSRRPSFAPTRSPTVARFCQEFKQPGGCCGKAFADGRSKVCKNTLVQFPGCRWKTKDVPKPGKCLPAKMPPTTSAPTSPRPATKTPSLSPTRKPTIAKVTTKPTSKAPTKKTTKSPTKPTKKPTKAPTRKPTKKGETFAPTSPEYEYEYEYEYEDAD